MGIYKYTRSHNLLEKFIDMIKKHKNITDEMLFDIKN